MTHFDYVPQQKESETITFGTENQRITIDLSYIPSIVAYNIKVDIDNEKGKTVYSVETLSKILSYFTDTVSADWIAENVEYGVMDAIVAKIYKRAFFITPRKN